MHSPEAPLEQSYLSYYFGWLSRQLQREGWEYIAIVGLGVNDFVYRIITLFRSSGFMPGFEAWLPCIDSVHSYGHGER